MESLKQLKANELAIILRPKREGNLEALAASVNDFFVFLQKTYTVFLIFTQA